MRFLAFAKDARYPRIFPLEASYGNSPSYRRDKVPDGNRARGVGAIYKQMLRNPSERFLADGLPIPIIHPDGRIRPTKGRARPAQPDHFGLPPPSVAARRRGVSHLVQ